VNQRVLAVDLPGFGKSEILPQPFSIDQVADRLAEWFGELNLEQPVVVGHSLGGYVSLALLERHAKLLSGVVLFHSTAYADSPERKQVRNKVIAFVQENGVAPFIETFVPGLFADKNDPALEATRVRCEKTTSDALVGYAAAMRDRPDRSALLSETSVPVLIIGGTKDTLIPIADLKKLTVKAAKLRLIELENSAHMGMFEAKNQSQSALSSYLHGIWPIQGT